MTLIAYPDRDQVWVPPRCGIEFLSTGLRCNRANGHDEPHVAAEADHRVEWDAVSVTLRGKAGKSCRR